METYLKRTYRQTMARAKRKQQEEETTNDNFPFWDYRSRRGSLSTTSGSNTSSSSGSSSFDGCSLSSLSSIRTTDNASVHSSSLGSDSDSIMITSDPYRLQLQFLVDHHEVVPLMDLYQPVIDWIDQDLRIFKIGEKMDDSNVNQSFNQPKRVSRMPSLAIMLFLSEEGPLGCSRIQSAKRRFEKSPWKFHHSEQVGQGKINPYPYNSPDYFYTSEELPLWAIRMVHCGKELLRIVLFTSQESWDDMVQFYKLVIGFEPEINKDDFCVFTVHSHGHYDVQLALKKLKGETVPRNLDSVKLQFKVAEVGNLVPLFPNVCKPIADNLWETQDHDGNTITIDVIGKPRPKSSTPEQKTMTSRSRTSSRSSASSRESRGSRSSARSGKSVQSLTSVTSSSMTTSMTSVSSNQSEARSDLSGGLKQINYDVNDDVPPKLPPRVPLKNGRLKPPIPEKPKQCLASLQGFYV